MPRKIIIVRHGETEWNVTRRLQGWSDIPLNPNGREQARQVASRLSHESVTAIYTSDQQRAHATARAIAKLHELKPKRRQALREDRMGVFEGWQWEHEVDPFKQKLWEERTLARANGDLDWKPEGGESLREHARRVKRFVGQIEAKHPDDVVMIVTHGGTINRFMEIFGHKKITDEYTRYKNTSITILIREGDKYTLSLHNDITHLG